MIWVCFIWVMGSVSLSPSVVLCVSQSESSAVRVRLLWDTLTPDTDQWPPLYILWRIHSKTETLWETRTRTSTVCNTLTSSVAVPPPGGVPMRSYSWRRHNHPFTLSFLEEVLRWVGMNEVHKAVTLFLDTLAKQPGSAWTQRCERRTHTHGYKQRV